MDTPRPYLKITLFLLGLGALFATSVAVGSAVDPAETKSETEGTMDAHGSHGTTAAGKHEPAGLGVSADGYTLRLNPTQLSQGERSNLRFRIEHDGKSVTEFDELHERRMHLIVVRRDGTEFRHLHPEMGADGTWSVPEAFGEAGVYRVFADFSVEGLQETLATDLFVSGGEFEARPFPAPQPVAKPASYEVELDAETPVTTAKPVALTFAVSENGRPVDGLQPYLGADGHLVALREGDLAFLHVHPEEERGASDEIVFEAEFPTAGRYRLYLQFRHAGAVRTAGFTVEVAE